MHHFSMSSTSRLAGIDGAAPLRVVEIPAALFAILTAASRFSPFARQAAITPQKQSPAPVVSIDFTVNASI